MSPVNYLGTLNFKNTSTVHANFSTMLSHSEIFLAIALILEDSTKFGRRFITGSLTPTEWITRMAMLVSRQHWHRLHSCRRTAMHSVFVFKFKTSRAYAII